jgi:hypothetical protein
MLAGNLSGLTGLVIHSGGTLAGVGTVTTPGGFIVQSGGTLAVGGLGSAGTLNLDSNLTMAAGSALAIDINGTTAGSGYDRLFVTGTPDVAGATLAVTHGYAATNGDSYAVLLNNSGNAITGSYTLPNNGKLSDGFHTYAVEWEPNVVRWYVDNQLYETRTPGDLPDGTRWVYDHNFFIILNVAVGGNFPGDPDGSTVFPQKMKVAYVRVYKR